MPETVMTFLGAVLVAAITGAVTWGTTKLTATGQKNTAEVESRGPEWEKFFDTVKDWTGKELESRDKDIERLTERVDSLKSKVDSLQGKYRAALRYARAWRLLHPESVKEVDVPAEIVEDI